MVHPKPYPKCTFCGARADSREHAIPKWISKRLGIKVFLPAPEAIIFGTKRRKQPISFASHRARIFCKGCNSHFKHLEDAVIPRLSRNIRTRQRPPETPSITTTRTRANLIVSQAGELEITPVRMDLTGKGTRTEIERAVLSAHHERAEAVGERIHS